jgi:hypothetical protein
MPFDLFLVRIFLSLHVTSRSPRDGPLESYISYLRAWPQRDEPEVFGMHDNANVIFNLQVSVLWQCEGSKACPVVFKPCNSRYEVVWLMANALIKDRHV